MIRRNCTRRCSEKLALISCEQALWVLFSVQCSRSVVSDSVTPWTAASQASLSITNSRGLLKLMSIELVKPSNHLILCRPLLLLPSIFPSIRVFSNESALHIRWPKYWSFSFNISPSNEHPGLISFRMDWFCITSIQNQFLGTELLRDNCFLFLVLLNWWGHYLWHKIQDIRCTFQVSASQSVQLLSRVRLSVTPMDRSTLGLHPSPTPGACSNSCPSSWWCHPTISSSVVPFSSHLQSFPTSASFPKSRLFASGGQSTGVSVSASAKLNIQDWFPLGLTGWISFRCVFQVWFGAYTCNGIATKKIKLSLENIFFLVRSQVFGKKYVRSLCWKVSWSRKWLSIPVFFPAKSHGQRSLAGYS